MNSFETEWNGERRMNIDMFLHRVHGNGMENDVGRVVVDNIKQGNEYGLWKEGL